MIPPRTTLTAAIQTALGAITQEDGARTNIGRLVYVGAHPVNDNELPCCVLTPGQETLAPDAGPLGHVAVAYTVSGYVNRRDSKAEEYTADPCAEFALVDAIIADVRDAIEGTGCVLASEAYSVVYQGAVPHYHEDGGEACGASLSYQITTPYIDFIPGQ